MSSGLVALCLLLLQTGALGFSILATDKLTHQVITETGLLQATVQACLNLAKAEGKDFKTPSLNTEAVVRACDSPESSKSFHQVIDVIKDTNKQVDISQWYIPNYHFDDESFYQGRKIITDGLSAIKASNKEGKFEEARKTLGEILHPLQDFYSHSNWVELGNTQPNSNLIRSDTSIGNIADATRATCQNCADDDGCSNNILQDILRENILTSGYFSVNPFHTKPKGKCSHGGSFDQTRFQVPKGGINKDKPTSNHGYLHSAAATIAIAATTELLDDVRGAAGDRDFLRMMGISKGSNKALCFVIDTTESTSYDLNTVKNVTSSIIDSKVGTKDEPSAYILVSFSDTDFGPVITTSDPTEFKKKVNALFAFGAGSSSDMSLSGLQLALTSAPPGSESFLFTDTTAKDSYLKNAEIALIERTKTLVYFMLIDSSGLRRRRQSDGVVSLMTRTDYQLYKDLAQTSGGYAVEVTKSQLPEATRLITQYSRASQVTLLRVVRSIGRAENVSFSVDESVNNLTIYITGLSLNFNLISPSGVSQSSTSLTGPLGTIQQVGNILTFQLNKEIGQWVIRMVSVQPYSLKVLGHSAIDFLFKFVEFFYGQSEGFKALGSRPRAGVNATLLVSITGTNSSILTNVTLVKTSGSGEVTGSVESLGGGDFFVRFDRIPSEEFVVRVEGQDTSSIASTVSFQRQSSNTLRSSNLTIKADLDSGVLEPGTPFSVSFTVSTNGTGGAFTISATNDRSLNVISPASLFLDTGGSANGTMSITAPRNTLSGSSVTLTIEAEAPGGVDNNYAELRYSVSGSNHQMMCLSLYFTVLVLIMLYHQGSD